MIAKNKIKIVFMGTPDFSVPILNMLVNEGYQVVAAFTQPDRPVGRKRVLTPPPVKVAAQALNIPVFQPEKVGTPEAIAQIQALEPDVIITAAFGQILPEAILAIPPHRCINVHASLLPRLRGGAPIHYAIINGDHEAGVTLMYMVKRLDAGDMLAKVSIPILEEDTVGTLHDKLSLAGTDLLQKNLPQLLAGQLEAIPQDESQVTFAPNIQRSQEKIDWQQTGEAIYNHVRGMNPWPVAYTTLNGQILKIWRTEKQLIEENQALAGTILAIQKDGLVVKTGNQTAIIIKELQLAGKKKVTAQQFLANKSEYLGLQLGVTHD